MLGCWAGCIGFRHPAKLGEFCLEVFLAELSFAPRNVFVELSWGEELHLSNRRGSVNLAPHEAIQDLSTLRRSWMHGQQPNGLRLSCGAQCTVPQLDGLPSKRRRQLQAHVRRRASPRSEERRVGKEGR